MILVNWAENTYILKENTQAIDLEALNLLIVNFLKNRNELDNEASVVRARRHSSYVIICGYASLSFDNLRCFITTFLNEYNIKFEDGVLTTDDLKELKPILPVVSIRKNDQHGGINNDTPSIDLNVKSLSDALNTYPGITTFSSCEGHLDGKGETNFYILFTSDNMENLNRLTFNLWNGLEKVMTEYKDIPIPNLFFDYGDWPSISSTYFEIRLQYRAKTQALVFKAMNYLAELLIED